MESEKEKLRIDKWLWAARFFKTRSSATDAVNKGQVLVNGQKPKPSRGIGVGDTLSIFRSPQEFTVTVLALNEKRRPAAEARLLYLESEESIVRREATAAQLRDEWAVVRGLRGEGRPTKRQRRQIIRFQTTQSEAPDDNDAGTVPPADTQRD